jgi:hypothetical protein
VRKAGGAEEKKNETNPGTSTRWHFFIEENSWAPLPSLGLRLDDWWTRPTSPRDDRRWPRTGRD